MAPGAGDGAKRSDLEQATAVHLGATLVDAFSAHPFAGNPAAVVLVEQWPEEDVMQAVAGELHLSETAFVVPRSDGQYDLRWFTPAVEVDLCGHATLAAAHVLGGAARFHTRSGLLDCTVEDPPGEDVPVEGVDRPGGVEPGWISMALPADPPRREPEQAWMEALDLPGLVWSGRGRFDAVAVLGDPDAVRGLVPDLRAVAGLGTRGLVVTAVGDRPGIDFVSRFFAPNAGVDEDPVTGSAHCLLAELWGDRLGRDRLVGAQVSVRGGIVGVRRRGNVVDVSGQAVTVGRIELDF